MECIFLYFSKEYHYRENKVPYAHHYNPYPIFEDHFFIFKELFFKKFCPYVCNSRSVCDQKRVLMAPVQ